MVLHLVLGYGPVDRAATRSICIHGYASMNNLPRNRSTSLIKGTSGLVYTKRQAIKTRYYVKTVVTAVNREQALPRFGRFAYDVSDVG